MLVIVFGPPAVGKMTIGRAVCARTDFRLLHNHMTLEPLLETFGFGTPAFNQLNGEFRWRVLEEARRNSVDLVFSLIWALDCDEDRQIMERYVELFDDEVAFVELRAGLEQRLERNRTEHRLLHKASKRDLEWSDANVREMEQQWQMTSERGAFLAGDLLQGHPHLVVDTAELDADRAADCIVDWLAGLPQADGPRWVAQRDEPLPEDAARLLAGVPEWFGIPEANQEYIEAARVKETWSVRDEDGAVVGLALMDRHFPRMAELHLMVVDREHHGSGIGTALVRAVEDDTRARGGLLLQVKTLGASHPDVGYARTRHFYERMGFLPLEETELWGEGTPCLFMVKPLGVALP